MICNTIKTNIGTAKVYIYKDKLVCLTIGKQYLRDEWRAKYFANDREQSTEIHPLSVELNRQLALYFAGKLQQFSIEYALFGTQYQQTVWRALLDIPYGKTITYALLARMAGGSSRSVGTAVGANPLPLILPCHRVVNANGKIGNFSCGQGSSTKEQLLDLEMRDI